MPRPRKDSEILSATERLENAFWELLADHEYRKITVTEVVREAHVNRNSFYYHYASLPELADSAIMHAVEHSTVQAPRADLNPDIEWRRQCSLVMNDPVQRQRLDRLALLAGSHSSPELIESLKDFGRLMIINDLQLDADLSEAAVLKKLDELERIARRNGTAIGIASAFDESVDAIRKWCEEAETRGVEIVGVASLAGIPARK